MVVGGGAAYRSSPSIRSVASGERERQDRRFEYSISGTRPLAAWSSDASRTLEDRGRRQLAPFLFCDKKLGAGVQVLFCSLTRSCSEFSSCAACVSPFRSRHVYAGVAAKSIHLATTALHVRVQVCAGYGPLSSSSSRWEASGSGG